MSNTTNIVSIQFDAPLAWLDELTNRFLALGEIVPRPVEIIELVRRLPDRTAAFNCRSLPTGRANDYRIVLEPSDALLSLMTTLRAL